MEIGKKVSTGTKAGEEAKKISEERERKMEEECASFGELRILGRQLRGLVRGTRIKGNFQILRKARALFLRLLWFTGREEK